MGSQIGKTFKTTVFGESHGTAVGCVIEGIPAGTVLDMAHIKKRMSQRRPGQGTHSTPRQEKDSFEIVSGVVEDVTTGTPLTMLIRNHDTRSKDYSRTKDLMRPSHADFTGHVKWDGNNDYRGGGHFSARLTAAVVFSGAIAEQLLKAMGIDILTQIESIGSQTAESLVIRPELESLRMAFDEKGIWISSEHEASFLEEVEQARSELDSVGGVVETIVTGMPVGIGGPMFDTIEGRLSYGLFGIPAVKGISFGDGFAFGAARGSEVNDAFGIKEGQIVTETNHNGGINGGISNGMPIHFRCVFKPTPSIAREQKTVNIKTMTEETLQIEGRHDPCVAIRGAIVVKAVTAMTLYDLIRTEAPHV